MKKLKKIFTISLIVISLIYIVNLCGGPGGVSPAATEATLQIK